MWPSRHVTPRQLQGVDVVSQPALSCQAVPAVLVKSSCSAPHSVAGIALTPAQKSTGIAGVLAVTSRL